MSDKQDDGLHSHYQEDPDRYGETRNDDDPRCHEHVSAEQYEERLEKDGEEIQEGVDNFQQPEDIPPEEERDYKRSDDID
jgi:hypothetical protein